MKKLIKNMNIELKEILRTEDDVEDAFLRRGYTFEVRSGIPNRFKIIASIINDEGDKITYEFDGNSLDRPSVTEAATSRHEYD